MFKSRQFKICCWNADLCSEEHSDNAVGEGGEASGSCTRATLSDADVEMQRLIDSQVESHKIGSAIAEEALRRSSSEFSPDLPADLLQDVVFNQQVTQLYCRTNSPVTPSMKRGKLLYYCRSNSSPSIALYGVWKILFSSNH